MDQLPIRPQPPQQTSLKPIDIFLLCVAGFIFLIGLVVLILYLTGVLNQTVSVIAANTSNTSNNFPIPIQTSQAPTSASPIQTFPTGSIPSEGPIGDGSLVMTLPNIDENQAITLTLNELAGTYTPSAGNTLVPMFLHTSVS